MSLDEQYMRIKEEEGLQWLKTPTSKLQYFLVVTYVSDS